MTETLNRLTATPEQWGIKAAEAAVQRWRGNADFWRILLSRPRIYPTDSIWSWIVGGFCNLPSAGVPGSCSNERFVVPHLQGFASALLGVSVESIEDRLRAMEHLAVGVTR